MWRNYLIVALRNIKNHKGFSLINIAGLAIGIASCLLISLFVQSELSYDRFHEQKKIDARIDVTPELQNHSYLNDSAGSAKAVLTE